MSSLNFLFKKNLKRNWFSSLKIISTKDIATFSVFDSNNVGIQFWYWRKYHILRLQFQNGSKLNSSGPHRETQNTWLWSKEPKWRMNTLSIRKSAYYSRCSYRHGEPFVNVTVVFPSFIQIYKCETCQFSIPMNFLIEIP